MKLDFRSDSAGPNLTILSKPDDLFKILRRLLYDIICVIQLLFDLYGIAVVN